MNDSMNDSMNDNGNYRIMYFSCELPSHVDQGIIGLMDPPHGPFVHQSWFWRKRHSIHEKSKEFEPIPNGFRMSKHSPGSNSLPVEWLLRMPGDTVTPPVGFALRTHRLQESA